MATINFAGLTIPTPAAYNADAPLQQLETLAYVLLQGLALAKANGVVYDDQALVTLNGTLDTLNGKLDTLNGKLADLETAIAGIGLTVNPPDLTTINTQLTALAEAFQ